MKIRRLAATPAVLALGAALIAAWGCNKKPNVPIVPGNQRPAVRITSAPLDTTARNYYVITLNWIGFDPDGRVDHFLLAIDPPTDPGSDTLWETTTENQLTKSFPCPLPDDPRSPATWKTRSSDFHVFVIKAVDNQGAISPPVARAFWSYTVAPRVRVRNPPASDLVRYYVTPAVLFRWDGFDDDGVFTQKPVKYKFTMLTDQTEVTLQTANTNPDSVRRYYAPRHWAGWDSVGGDTTEKQFTGLTVEQDYMFVVVAFDEAGAYSPLFNRSNNMILLRITYAGAQNPRIGIFNEFFLYEYDQGSYRPLDPTQVIPLEVPASRSAQDKLTFNWYALPAADRNGNLVGGPIRTYRWAVDILDVYDETRRSDEETDLSHWSQKSDAITSARIGPYPGGQVHKFYIEAEDVNNLKSLGVVEFTTVQASFDKQLLIVDDTRYQLDRVNIGTACSHSSNRPIGNWPTAAELDTFLFAVGDKPWKCYPPPVAGGPPQLSSAGIFNGYEFDTLGTNLRIQDLTVKLSRLGQYRHVLWLVDGAAALNNKPGSDLGDLSGPTTSMRYMNDNRKANTIAAYVRQGGKVWLAGGGAATASLMNFNRGINDNSEPNPRTTTFRFTDNELVSGRFLYDQAHWRSEFKQFKVNNGRIKRYLSRFEKNPAGNPDPHGYRNLAPPALPADILLKTPATDKFPPNRIGSQNAFYQTQFDIEFLSASNEILEDLDAGPLEDFQSTLDTLYKATATTLQPDAGFGALQSTVMTHYHGGDNTPFIVTGFNLWNFQRANCKALVDFVFQRIWGLPAPTPATAFSSSGRPGGLAVAPERVWSAPARPGAAQQRQASRDARPAPPAAGRPRH